MSIAESSELRSAPVFIDGRRLYDFIVSGAGNIILNERNLNRINVFPVADGDTGTNLALTMRTIITKAERSEEVGRTMDSISRIAVENAYGNSGLIFAQFLHGFAESVHLKERITMQEFAESSSRAVQYAYRAVASPKEGTILTVMREWTEELGQLPVQETLEAWLERSVQRAKKIVEQTRTMMKVLRDNNVVDSGAKGFLLFLEGILSHVKNGGTVNLHQAAAAFEEEHVHVNLSETALDYRWCCQFVLQVDEKTVGTSDVTASLGRQLEGLGDSLVVTGTAPLLHVHMHADDPEQLMGQLQKHGAVVSHKADDMAVQQSISVRRRNRVGIVTDSIADVPASLLRDAQVVVIPVNIIQDGTAYLDKVTMTPSRFYREIDALSMHPTSAQPSLAAIERIFSFMLSHYDEVLGVFVSSGMSGLHHQASSVAKDLSVDGKRIRVLDTRQNSAAEGLLVLEAVRLADQGLDLDAIAVQVEKLAARTRIYVSLETLKFMLKGGRVSRTQGFVLGLLKLKPVVSIDPVGKGTVWAKTFSRKSAASRMLHAIEKDFRTHGIRSWGLVYADDSSVMTEFRKRAETIIGMPPAYIEPISAVVALNAGRGTFAVAYVMEGA